ncbi:MAG: hypothetical protein ACKOYM_07950 [Actinomycetes bacterium]
MGEVVENNQQRIEEFKSEIDSLNLKGSSGENEQKFLIGGVALLAVGALLAVYGAVQVGNNGGSLADQVAFLAQGSLVGIVLAIVGGMLFLRYSLGRYLRFWMIRQTYESRANTDRLVDAIERAAGLEPTATSRAPIAQQFAPQPAPAAAAPLVAPAAAPAPAPAPAPQPQFAPPPPPPAAPLR